ncbi:hypothetical protein CUC44_13665 [Aeromonas lusitana]|uniref:Uncharacterized protein n=1 Tax=Aeromonas lusitana TaxID=931529 RepID=A0A2M8H7N9_9GAMM|nr:hypothetical protein CUC44_13665 [Aeromonas lusitana]
MGEMAGRNRGEEGTGADKRGRRILMTWPIILIWHYILYRYAARLEPEGVGARYLILGGQSVALS